MLQRIFGKKEGGFTIIEVMIVLAIAGLILVVVLIAVPQLQRNQRNEARRSILSRMATEIANFQGNNNGDLPEAIFTADTDYFGTPRSATGFMGRYLDCGDAGDGVAASCGVNIDDPRTNYPVGSGPSGTTTNIVAADQPAAAAEGENFNGEGNLAYQTGAICDGETMTSSGATGRNYAIVIALEGGAFACVDNQ